MKAALDSGSGPPLGAPSLVNRGPPARGAPSEGTGFRANRGFRDRGEARKRAQRRVARRILSVSLSPRANARARARRRTRGMSHSWRVTRRSASTVEVLERHRARRRGWRVGDCRVRAEAYARRIADWRAPPPEGCSTAVALARGCGALSSPRGRRSPATLGGLCGSWRPGSRGWWDLADSTCDLTPQRWVTSSADASTLLIRSRLRAHHRAGCHR